MTDDILYLRQKDIDINIPESITVIGCGGVGSWTAIYSAMIGIQNITIFDNDTIEEHNLNRLPFGHDSIGKDKLEVLKDLLVSLRPDINITVIKEKIDDMNKGFIVTDIVMDCTDSYTTQLLISKYCSEQGIQYIHGGYEETHITVSSTVPKWDVDTEDVSGYNTPPVPSFVIPATLVASLMVASIVTDNIPDVSTYISDMLYRKSDKKEADKDD